MLRLAVVAGFLAQAVLPPFPPPVALEANQIFHEAFIALMQRQSAEWQLQPLRRRGPSPSGPPADGTEELTWRRSDQSYALARYGRYSSTEAAAAALASKRLMISIGTRAVKLGDPPGALADEAYTSGQSMLWRRGVFVFELALIEPAGPNLFPVTRLSALFLGAADRVLTETGAR